MFLEHNSKKLLLKKIYYLCYILHMLSERKKQIMRNFKDYDTYAN